MSEFDHLVEMLRSYAEGEEDTLGGRIKLDAADRINDLETGLRKIATGEWWDGNEPQQVYRVESYAKSILGMIE